MEGTATIKGLEDVMRTLENAFPKNAKAQRSLLNQAMSGSARKSIVPIAKQRAMRGDSSGALSEAIAPRAVSASRARRKGATASVQVTPVRFNKKAIAKYIQYYYTDRGKTAKTNIVASGIRHGHLVEFGTAHSGAFPFMWPAAQQGRSGYVNNFAATLEKKIEAAVKRRRKKAMKK